MVSLETLVRLVVRVILDHLVSLETLDSSVFLDNLEDLDSQVLQVSLVL